MNQNRSISDQNRVQKGSNRVLYQFRLIRTKSQPKRTNGNPKQPIFHFLGGRFLGQAGPNQQVLFIRGGRDFFFFGKCVSFCEKGVFGVKFDRFCEEGVFGVKFDKFCGPGRAR